MIPLDVSSIPSLPPPSSSHLPSPFTFASFVNVVTVLPRKSWLFHAPSQRPRFLTPHALRRRPRSYALPPLNRPPTSLPSPPCVLVMQRSDKNEKDGKPHYEDQPVSSSLSSATPSSSSDPLIPSEIQPVAPPSPGSSSTMRSSPPSPPPPPSHSNLIRLKIAGGVFGAIIVGVGVLAATGHLSMDTLLSVAAYFEGMGPSAIFYYAFLYFCLELIAVPALPLTLGSGYLFGVTRGTIAVSISSSLAAAAAFLIARYALRDAFMSIAQRYTRFRAIDRAISREGFKFVFLLRLSPLLPFSISNYLYGLTSVQFLPFTFASWLGMLPGTIAYVSTGAAVSALQDLGSGTATKVNPLLLGIGLLATIAALTLGGRAAQRAISEIEEEESATGISTVDSVSSESVDKLHP